MNRAWETRIFRHLTKGLLLLAASLLVAPGCGHGKIRDGVYLAPEEHYRISLPPNSWKRVTRDGADLVLASRESGGSILISSLCDRYAEADLDVLARNLFIGTAHRQILESGPVKLPAGDGQRLQVRARLEGTDFRAEAYTFKRGGCVYDFVCLSEPARFEENLQVFTTMMQSLRFGSENPE